MSKKLQLSPLPIAGPVATITTTDCAVDHIILEVSHSQVVKYFAAIRVNGDTDVNLPEGPYRFSFHYLNSSATAKFNSSVKTPKGTFPTNPANGSGTAAKGAHGLTGYRVEV